MKSIKNPRNPNIMVSCIRHAFESCFHCLEPMKQNTYMHDDCWHEADEREKRMAEDALYSAIEQGLREINRDEYEANY